MANRNEPHLFMLSLSTLPEKCSIPERNCCVLCLPQSGNRRQFTRSPCQSQQLTFPDTYVQGGLAITHSKHDPISPLHTNLQQSFGTQNPASISRNMSLYQ
ncbi:hypothetical protein XENTR_v10000717 [Xenopus tropicalis]|nr:hypothetical protein XENTR_v10000717 [Xenopus tropicalis]